MRLPKTAWVSLQVAAVLSVLLVFGAWREDAPVPPLQRAGAAAQSAEPSPALETRSPALSRDGASRRPAASAVPSPAARPAEPPSAPPASGLTVVLMSWPGSDRFHRLVRIAREAASWPFTTAVLLVWNGARGSVPEPVAALERERVVAILPQGSNRLDNRWKADVSTAAVMNVDDDVDIRRDGAECLWNLWRQHGGLVAVDVRAHTDDAASLQRARRRAGAQHVDKVAYASRHPLLGGGFGYSIALPRAVIGPSALWRAYSSAPAGVAAVVTELLCDDIAFNYVAANATGRPPLYARAPFRPFAESQSKHSLQKSKGMKGRRQKCITDLSRVYGSTPLKHNDVYAVCGGGMRKWDGESGNHGKRR